MNRILIINLARMGDLVQMLGLVGGLRRRWPEARIEVLVMRAFSGILGHFPNIDEVLLLEDEYIVGRLDTDLWSGFREMSRCIDRLNERDYDLLISPVVSQHVAWMAYPIRARQRLGMFVNRHRQQTVNSEWTAFHLANEHHLGDRTFNIVDIFAHVGGVAARPEDFRLLPGHGAEAKAAAVWREHGLNGRQVVGVHVGASRSNKTWEPERFRDVIEMLLTDSTRSVVLFGGYNELALAPFFDKLHHPHFVTLIGKSGLSDLLAMLARLDLFISNDTGPMHLAASVGTPILNLSLGPVSMWETGPYQPGAVILQADIPCHPCGFDSVCSHLRCHDLITPQAVHASAEAMLAGRTPLPTEGVRIWRTCVDPFGLLHNVPASPCPIRPRELFFEAKRTVWALTLLPGLELNNDWSADFRNNLEMHYQTKRRNMQPWLHNLERLQGRCVQLTDALKDMACRRPATKKSIDAIREKWTNIKRLKKELFDLARETRECYDFFLYAGFRESSLTGDDFSRLTREMLEIYSGLCLQLQTLARLTRTCHVDQAQ